jgi:hypothetical protein
MLYETKTPKLSTVLVWFSLTFSRIIIPNSVGFDGQNRTEPDREHQYYHYIFWELNRVSKVKNKHESWSSSWDLVREARDYIQDLV